MQAFKVLLRTGASHGSTEFSALQSSDQMGNGQKLQDESALHSKLASIVEFSDDAIVSKTLEGVITSWNRGAERLFGYRAEEALGNSLLMLFPPDRQAEEALILARIAGGETVDHLETVRRHKDGRELHVSVTISPIRDRSGRIVAASKIARDIGSRRLADEALRLNEARLQALLDNISCAVVVHGADTHIIDANPAACRMLGLSLEQMRGKVAIDPDWCFLEEDGTLMPLQRYPVQQVLSTHDALRKLILGVRREPPRYSWRPVGVSQAEVADSAS